MINNNEKYSVTRSLPYGYGIVALRGLGKEPLNAADVMQARLEQPELYDFDFWTVTGIAYKSEVSLIKIILNCELLKTIDEGFEGDCITNFNINELKGQFLNGHNFECFASLTKKEILAHQGWLALAGEDNSLLEKYVNAALVHYENKYRKETKSLMSFHIPLGGLPFIPSDQLRPVFMCGSNAGPSTGFDIDGYIGVDLHGRFLFRN